MDKQVASLTSISGGRDEKVRSGPPTLDEWHHFVSRVVIRTGTNWYVDNLFEDIEERVSDHDALRLRLTDEECDTIGKPLAELANKLKFTRKYGRLIISGAGSFESIVILGRWFSRVNRVARKYHSPPRQQPSQSEPIRGEVITPSEHQSAQQAPSGPANPNGASFRIYQPGTGA